MDRLQRRNPRSRPLKPPCPPRGRPFQPLPASRPPPEPSSPDGRPRKKVRFASEAGSHRIYAKQNANTGKAEKAKSQGSDAKTAEFKFFKKLWEQSGCKSRSFRQPQNIEPNISKEKEGAGLESHNVTLHRKFPVQKVTLCPDETPATPSNKEISDEQVNVQVYHSEYDNNDTLQLNPHDSLRTVHVLTPIIQTPFEVAGISRNTDTAPGSGRIFSEKRRKLLKLAAKIVSMESSELLQRRSEFFADILQRLGANSIIRKHHKEPMRQRKMVCRHTPADPGGHFENILDYRLIDFNSLTKLRTGIETSSYASDESSQFLALPWVDDLPHGVNEACITDLSSSDWKRDTVHNHVSNLLLEDVQPHTEGKPVPADELGCKIQTGPYGHHGWEPMLSVTLAESIPNRLSFPCQIEEQCAVPYETSNTFWQPDLCSSLKHRISRSVGLETEDLIGAGFFDNSDTGLLSRFEQLRAKCTSSSFLNLRNGILDHNGLSGISNFHASESNKILSNPNRSCLNSICSTSMSDYPFELGSKSLRDSAIHTSCLAGTEEKYSAEAELSDNSDIGLVQGLDQLLLKFTASSFSKYTSGIVDHHHDPMDSNGILSLDANGTCLNPLSSCSEHPCKQDSQSSCDFSSDLWSSVHPQSHGGSLGTMLGFMSNGGICNDLEDDCSDMLAEGSPNSGLFGTSDLSFFGSCSTMDSIRETPMLSLDGIRW